MIVLSTETLLACAWYNHAAGADSSGKGCSDYRFLNERSTLDISSDCFTVIPIYIYGGHCKSHDTRSTHVLIFALAVVKLFIYIYYF
jgi:uncharacterized membrane protein YobD (UPF0266 family)